MSDPLGEIFEDAVEKRVFPGASIWLSQGEKLFAQRAFGTTAGEAEYSRPVSTGTLYDVASLTKLFTATAFLIAARENRVSAEADLAQFLPEFDTSDKSHITLRDLLQHNSGIKIAIQSLVDLSPSEWIGRIAQASLHALPGTKVLYSCTNFFLLARVIEQLCGSPLDEFLTRKVLQPLKMARTSWFPLKQFSSEEIAPTALEDGLPNHGIVHDEAARAWQEYAGHGSSGNSGLFSTPEDLAAFSQLWMSAHQLAKLQILSEEEIEHAFLDTVPELDPVAKRGWGWQVDAPFFMCNKAPQGSAGHTGFTGPTLWLHRRTGFSCIILNNRVYTSRVGGPRFPVHRRAARWLIESA